jgi:ribosome modulation factor
MKGLATAVRGMRFVDTDEIIKQGRRAYHLGIEQRACPFGRQLERDLWMKGWETARDKWSMLLRRNGGFLGMRFHYGNPSR